MLQTLNLITQTVSTIVNGIDMIIFEINVFIPNAIIIIALTSNGLTAVIAVGLEDAIFASSKLGSLPNLSQELRTL